MTDETKYIRITKSDLARIEDVPISTLSRWMNKKYFEELSAVGYDKNDVSLSPNVVRKWFEIRGYPLTESEMNLYKAFALQNQERPE
jgi:hypothetical protein